MTDPDLTQTLERWCRVHVANDLAAAEELRADDYVAELPGGERMTKAQELSVLARTGNPIRAYEIVKVGPHGDHVQVEFRARTQGVTYSVTIVFRNRDGRWLATQARITGGPPPAQAYAAPRRSWRSWLRRRTKPAPPSFQTLAYLPYKPGENFALPRTTAPVHAPGDALPMPPRELWLGYDYPSYGEEHVRRMLAIAAESGFALRPGDGVLDFGCGAGRMIRHLREHAETGEVWGTDISAEHILWCKRNLSPPFRFATTTKVPHLPFEDRSFRLIYCGSVFTHIDDLADAWLLELRRVLAPDGRLYVTIHDNRTVELVESGAAPWLQWVRNHKVWRQAKGSFDMLTVGRDNESQVFYDRDYFTRTVAPAFEVLSITPQAYFYQTAVLLKRR